MRTAHSDRRRCGRWSAAVLFLCICCLLTGAGVLGACGRGGGSAAGAQGAGPAGNVPAGSDAGSAGQVGEGQMDGEAGAAGDIWQGGATASGASDGAGSGNAPGANDAIWGSEENWNQEQNREQTQQEDGTSGEQHFWITETETTSRPPFEVTRKADSFAGIVPDRFGSAGLLLIPDVGINVRLFDGSASSDPHNQKGVDMEDYAVLINYGGSDVIGDHSNQGFSAICRSVQGETRAYIVQEDHSYHEYICAGVLDGSNEEYHLYGSDGLDYMHAVSDRYDLVMYTCLENWEHIQIVLWKDVDAAVQSEYRLDE
ncbi:MAG: hypothetical protein IJI10_12800 [Eubacterium sp.]|nr:hypothetical protein [Eubacterium sp.]